ncbi:LysR family transcriptional regulator [Granulosicoccus sp. 3-233]|uniref:LysR family transcriptional regulator n=1 Tax=Granulosicoccus sp. 3-233 TaxID=3417969 RepID=UPI003D35298F
MDIATMKAFVAVAESGSFSRASEQLFMTQPAVSKRVAALEDDLGVTLFDRLGRGIQLTEAGQKFLTSSRRILADIQISRDEVLSLGADVGGRLRLATSHHVGIHRLPPVLKGFTQTYPDVELDLLFMDSELACDEVLSGHIELAVVTLPDQLENALLTELVWPDPLSIVCAPDHPLASKVMAGIEITAETLTSYNAVLPARGTVTRTILLEALQPFNVSVETSLETNYLETIKMMVSVGLGWSALPSNMIDEGVIAVPVRGLEMQRRLGSVCLRGRTLSRAAKAFIGLLQG